MVSCHLSDGFRKQGFTEPMMPKGAGAALPEITPAFLADQE